MLLELQIKNFALIDTLRLDFNRGLNILTGETGAGKSIIIDSVNFVLGQRASKDIIRTGTEGTYVEAVFEVCSNQELHELMDQYGIDNDDLIILSRELMSSGRGICRINGKVVTTSVLKSIGNYLIDIHGQHEHQSLLNENSHIEVLDMFGGSELNSMKKEVSDVYKRLQDIKAKLKSIMGDDRERERKLDLLNFQINEIDSARLRIGEEEELLKQRTILNNSGKLFSILSSVYNGLYESDDMVQAVFDRLGTILSELHGVVSIDEKLQDIYKMLESSYYQIESAISDIREYKDKIDFDPALIDEVESRLDVINKLKRKYGSSIQEILSYRENLFKEREEIINNEEVIRNLKKELDEVNDVMHSKSQILSDMRKDTARKLEKRITDELKFLGMGKARFVVDIKKSQINGQVYYSQNGMDDVIFMISTNPGEPEKPLSRIVSGGEMSRIMLAIKTVLADLDRIPSLIFDEIDTGISGKAAQAVAEKLGNIAKTHQVICVTHLPQIASMADTHFYISKTVSDEKTTTNIKKLNERGKIMEVARMLGGATITDLTLKHAEEMIKINQSLKQ